MRNGLIILLALAVPLLSQGVQARPPPPPAGQKAEADTLPPGALYRFRNAAGSLMISSVLPEQAIESGYEIIDNRGRVLRVVAAAVPEGERRKLQEEMRLRQQDAQLKRLYPTPADAERARDRQIASMRLGIDYARGIITQLDTKLAAEVATAAEAERAGRPVPEAVQGSIDLYTRQIREQEDKIANIEQDIVVVTNEFAPIIRRLTEIAGQR
jgi:hypothetical protein